MTYGRMRKRNHLYSETSFIYPNDYPQPVPEPGRAYPSRDTCWICEEPVPGDWTKLGVCSEFCAGVFAADRGNVLIRAHRQPPRVTWSLLVGDMNRMERDYLSPEYPDPPGAHREPGSDPAAQCAAATGESVDTVRRVLAYVFHLSR